MSSLILRGLFIQKREGDLHTVTKVHFLPKKNQIEENFWHTFDSIIYLEFRQKNENKFCKRVIFELKYEF